MTTFATLDESVAQIFEKLEPKNRPFSLQFEQFNHVSGQLSWRAVVKLGNEVWDWSKKDHHSPTGALAELCSSVKEKNGRRA